MNNDRRWYIIQTYSGFENSVKEDLERRIETMGQQDYIFNVLIPEEEYEETKKDGSKVVKTRKSYPSYVFVEMIVTEKSWFIVRNTPKVTGFLGSSGKGAKPVPVPPDIIMLNLALTQASKNIAISAVKVPILSKSSILSILLENFLIVIIGPVKDNGGIIALSLEPSLSLASTIGLDASIVLPNG